MATEDGILETISEKAQEQTGDTRYQALKPPEDMEKALEHLNDNSCSIERCDDTEPAALQNSEIVGPDPSNGAVTATESSSILHKTSKGETLPSVTGGIMETYEGGFFEAPSRVQASLEATNDNFQEENPSKEENEISERNSLREEIEEANNMNMNIFASPKHISEETCSEERITYREPAKASELPFEHKNGPTDTVELQTSSVDPSLQIACIDIGGTEKDNEGFSSRKTTDINGECNKMEKENIAEEETTMINTDSLCDKINTEDKVTILKYEDEYLKINTKENIDVEPGQKEVLTSEHDVQPISKVQEDKKLAEPSTVPLEDQNLESIDDIKVVKEQIVTEDEETDKIADVLSKKTDVQDEKIFGEKFAQDDETSADKIENSTTAPDQTQTKRENIVEVQAEDSLLEGEIQGRKVIEVSEMLTEEKISEASNMMENVAMEIPKYKSYVVTDTEISGKETIPEQETTYSRNEMVNEMSKEEEINRGINFPSVAQLTEKINPLNGEENKNLDEISEVMHDEEQYGEKASKHDEVDTQIAKCDMLDVQESQVDEGFKEIDAGNGTNDEKPEKAFDDRHVQITDSGPSNDVEGKEDVDSLSVIEAFKQGTASGAPQAMTEKHANEKINKGTLEPQPEKYEPESGKFERHFTAVSNEPEEIGRNANPEKENTEIEDLVVNMDGTSKEDENKYEEKGDVQERSQEDDRKYEVEKVNMEESSRENENKNEEEKAATNLTHEYQNMTNNGVSTETEMADVNNEKSDENVGDLLRAHKSFEEDKEIGCHMHKDVTSSLNEKLMHDVSNNMDHIKQKQELENLEQSSESVSENESHKEINDMETAKIDIVVDSNSIGKEIDAFSTSEASTEANIHPEKVTEQIYSTINDNECHDKNTEAALEVVTEKDSHERTQANRSMDSNFKDEQTDQTTAESSLHVEQMEGDKLDEENELKRGKEYFKQHMENENPVKTPTDETPDFILQKDKWEDKINNETEDMSKKMFMAEESVFTEDIEDNGHSGKQEIRQEKGGTGCPPEEAEAVEGIGTEDPSYRVRGEYEEIPHTVDEKDETETERMEDEGLLNKNNGDKSDIHTFSMQYIHDGEHGKHEEPTNHLCEEQTSETANNKDNMEIVEHKEGRCPKLELVAESLPEDEIQEADYKMEVTKIEEANVFEYSHNNKIPEMADPSDDTKDAKVKDENTLKNNLGNNPENYGLVSQRAHDVVDEKHDEAPSCMNEEQIHKTSNNEGEIEFDAHMEKTNAEKLDFISNSVPDDRSEEVLKITDLSIREEKAGYEKLENILIPEDQTEETSGESEAINVCDSIDDSNLNKKDSEAVAKMEPVKTILSENDKAQTVKIDSYENQSYDASNSCKENTYIIHLKEDNENANDNDEEKRNKKLDERPSVNELADEAELIGLNKDQSTLTIEQDHLGEKILNQEDYKVVETEVVNSIDEESISKSVDDSHVTLAPVGEAREAESKHEKAPGISKSVDNSHVPLAPVGEAREAESKHEKAPGISKSVNDSHVTLAPVGEAREAESKHEKAPDAPIGDQINEGITEKNSIITGTCVNKSDVAEGTSSVSQESVEEKTNETASFMEGDEHGHEISEASKSMGSTLSEETKTTDEAASMSSKQSQAMEVNKLNEVCGLISEDKLKSPEPEKNQDEEAPMEKEETLMEETSGSSSKENVLEKMNELESQEKQESISMYTSRDEKLPNKEETLDKIHENEGFESPAKVVSEKQELREDKATKHDDSIRIGCEVDEVIFQEKEENQMIEEAIPESDNRDDIKNGTTYEEAFETVAEDKIQVSENDETQTMKVDAYDGQSYDTSNANKENMNIIHLNEENENVNDADEENRDKRHDDLIIALADEAESTGLRGDQIETTTEQDETGNKILKQEANSDLTSTIMNLEVRAEIEPTKIEIAEDDNYNNFETEAVISVTEESISKRVDYSHVIPALVEETIEAEKKNNKAPDVLIEEEIHEDIIEKNSIIMGTGVNENDIADGTLPISQESIEEKTNTTVSSIVGNSHEISEASKSKRDTLFEEAKTINEAESMPSKQYQTMKVDKLNEVCGFISEEKLVSLEPERNQEKATPMKEEALETCYGIPSNMVSDNFAVAVEVGPPLEQIMDEEGAAKGIDKEVEDSNSISQENFKVTAKASSIDGGNCDPVDDALSSKEASGEENIQTNVSAKESEGHIYDEMTYRGTIEKSILDNENKEKQDLGISSETKELEDETQYEGNEKKTERKVSETISIYESNRKGSIEEKKLSERSLEKEKLEDVGLGNPLSFVPEEIQTTGANNNGDGLEKEGTDDTIELSIPEDSDKGNKKAIVGPDPVNHGNEPVLVCDTTEEAVPHEAIVKSMNVSDKVEYVDVSNKEKTGKEEDELSNTNNLSEKITNVEESGSHLQKETIEHVTLEKIEGKFESIDTGDEEEPEKNEELNVYLQKDAGEFIKLEDSSNIVLEKIETENSGEKIENKIIAEDILEGSDACMKDETTHKQFQIDETEADKNEEGQITWEPEITDTMEKPPNDEVKEFDCNPSEQNTRTILTEKIETASLIDEEDEKKNLIAAPDASMKDEADPDQFQKDSIEAEKNKEPQNKVQPETTDIITNECLNDEKIGTALDEDERKNLYAAPRTCMEDEAAHGQIQKDEIEKKSKEQQPKWEVKEYDNMANESPNNEVKEFDSKRSQQNSITTVLTEKIKTALSMDEDEKKNFEAAVAACVEDEMTHEQFQKDETEAEKNEEPQPKGKQEIIDTIQGESINDEVKEFEGMTSEQLSLNVLTEKIETASLMHEDENKNLDSLSHTLITAEETMQEVGQKHETSDFVPKESTQDDAMDAKFAKNQKSCVEGPTEVDKPEYTSSDSAYVQETVNVNDIAVDENENVNAIAVDESLRGEPVPERTPNVLLITEGSGINTLDQEVREKIGEVSNFISNKDTVERNNDSLKVTEDEGKSQRLSIVQTTDMRPPTEEERVQQTVEVDNSQNEEKQKDFDELPVARLLLDHILRDKSNMLDQTCETESEDKIQEKNGKGNDGSIQKLEGNSISLSYEQIIEKSTTEDRVEAHKNIEDTSGLLQEEQSCDEKEYTENVIINEDETPPSHPHYSSPLLEESEDVKGEVISKPEGISGSGPAEQVKEETSISEDKTEVPEKLENTSDLVTQEQKHDVKENTENVVLNYDEKQNNLHASYPIMAVGDSVKDKDSGLFCELSIHDVPDGSKKITTEKSGPDNKMDNGKSNNPDLDQDQKIHATIEEKNTGNLENLNKDFDVSSVAKGSPEDILQKEGEEHGKVISQDLDKVENTSDATTEEKTLSISDTVGNTKSILQCEEALPNPQYNQTRKSFKSSTTENQKHKEALEIKSDVKKEENREENHDEYSFEEPILSDSQKIQEACLVLESTNKSVHIAQNLGGERSAVVSIGEKQNNDTDTQMVEENDEKEEDEHKTKESGQDVTVIAEARDTNPKQVHKKSHNILSGVGSKVKHSLAKVKKAITGKSTHPKVASPK